MNETEYNFIDQLKEYSLSNTDIQDILEVDTNIFDYTHLYKVNHIDEVFDSKGRAILLYLTSDMNTGHWTSLIKRGNLIEFSDSYGFKPDTQNENLNADKSVVKEAGQDYPKLLELIADAGYSLDWNKKKFQPINDYTSATCGRHAVLRLIFYKLPLEEFNKLMIQLAKHNKTEVDNIVSGITYTILGK